MKIRVLAKGEGVKLVEASELTFHEHELMLDHWEAVYRTLHARGRYDDEKLAERLAVVKKGRDRLYSGGVPHK